MERFVYVIAFDGDRFIMVRHRSRAWEMPGGRLLKGETHEQAAVREFFEETGMSLRVVAPVKADLRGGKVFAGVVEGRISSLKADPEIVEVKGFSELPSELSFPRIEYGTMLERARFALETFKRGNNIVAPASPQ